jgi:mannose-6-phosphate isomerase-like protein (cupin superfamily)
MMEIRALADMPAFITADGSAIRELAGPTAQSAGSAHQSLAEATVGPNAETAEHYHPRAEEIYWFVRGAGRMRLGDQDAAVSAGDCVVIPPGTPHKLFNPGPEPLVLMCCCAPPYSDDDTVLTGG